MCEQFGSIESTKAIIEKTSLKCKGYGFVDFKSSFDALKAVEHLEKDGKDIKFARQRIQDPTNIYFANLPKDVDEKQLAEMLETKFDTIVNSTRFFVKLFYMF
jgi:RNA recognition motif-containing protein